MLFLAAAAASLFPLGASAAANPAPVSVEATTYDQKIKCRRNEANGGRTKGEKVCKTIAEWRYLKDRGNDNAREIVDYSRTRPGGQ